MKFLMKDTTNSRGMTEKSVLSVQELARQMGISLPKAYELVKEPGFPAIRRASRTSMPCVLSGRNMTASVSESSVICLPSIWITVSQTV